MHSPHTHTLTASPSTDATYIRSIRPLPVYLYPPLAMSRREKGTKKRLMKELVDSRSGTQGATDHVFLEPLDEHELTEWSVVLTPEKGSLYEGGAFKIAVTIGER